MLYVFSTGQQRLFRVASLFWAVPTGSIFRSVGMSEKVWITKQACVDVNIRDAVKIITPKREERFDDGRREHGKKRTWNKGNLVSVFEGVLTPNFKEAEMTRLTASFVCGDISLVVGTMTVWCNVY